MEKITTFKELKAGEYFIILGPPASTCLRKKISSRRWVNLFTGEKFSEALFEVHKVMAVSFKPKKLMIEFVKERQKKT